MNNYVYTECIRLDVTQKQELRKHNEESLVLVTYAAMCLPTVRFTDRHVFYTESVRNVFVDD